MIELERVERLNGDLSVIKIRLNECKSKGTEITETVRNRILADKKSSDRRAEELAKEIASGSCSDAARRIKQSEIDAIASRKYEPTKIEREEFEAVIEEYKATLKELRGKQDELRGAISDARHSLEQMKTDICKNADPVLMERYISSQITDFKKITILAEEQ